MAGRIWGGTEGGTLVNELDETSCELPADGGMLKRISSVGVNQTLGRNFG